MPNTIGKGVVEVVYDKGQAEKSARDAILPGLSRVAGDMVGVFAGKKIFDFTKQGFAELGEAERVAALTTSTIKATGGAAGVTAEQVSGLAGSLAEVSGKDDELIQSGANLILTFKNVKNAAGEGNDVFDQATTAALNLSTAGFGSMESASIMLGKALNDPIAGMTALGRAGVTFSDDQKAAIKSLVDTGDLLGAQKVILGEVEAQVGGAAEAYGDTLPGKLERAQNAMDETKAAMVAGLAPALETGASLAVIAGEKFQELPEPLQKIAGAAILVGGGVGALARPIGDAIRLFQMMKPAAIEAAVATEAAGAASVTTGGKVGGLKGALGKAGLVGAAGLATFALYELGVSMNDTGLSAQDLDRLTKSSAEDILKVFSDLEKLDTGAFAEGFNKAIDDLAAKGPDGVGVLTQLRDHYAEIGDSEHLGKVDAALQEAAESQANLTENAKLGSEALDDGSESADDYSKSIHDANDEMLSFTDTVLGSFGAALQLSDAQIAGRAAIAELTEATKDSSLSQDELQSKTNEAYEAILSQAEAARDSAQAQIEAAGGTFTAVDANKALITELQSVADTLDPSSPLKQQLLDYIGKLQAVPLDVHTDTVLKTEDAIAKWEEYVELLKSTPYQIETIANVRTPGPRAHGGPVAPGEVFEGGEEGWEILFHGIHQAPASGGFVMPHDESKRFLAPGLGAQVGIGGATNIYVTPPAGESDPYGYGRAVGRGIRDEVARV